MNVVARHVAIATALAFGVCALAQAQEREEKGNAVERTAKDAAEHVDDAWITTKVKTDLLATKDVSGTAIDVDTKNGIVTLNGKVASRAEEEKAISVAKSIHGVTSVKSNLKVAAAGDKDHAAAHTTADASEQMGDSWISTKVKADLLATKGVPGSAIDVDTKDGVVTLKGTVASREEENRAIAVAKDIHGVTKVKSNLKVAPAK